MNTKLSCSLALALTLGFTPQTQANLNFNLVPDENTPQFAVDAFTAAASRWSAVLANDITVNVQIGFSSLGPQIIGQSGSDFREFTYTETVGALTANRLSTADYSSVAALQPGDNFSRLINHTSNNPNGPNSVTPYLDTMNRVGITTANAKVLGLLAPGASIDAVIRFNSDFAFDFSPADGIDAGAYDFVGAATHELGHALGFVSGVDDIDQLGGVLPDLAFSSNLLDLFRYSAESLAMGPGITDYTADNRTKFFSVNGGVTLLAPFATGVFNGDGNQASHWIDFLGIGLMDPTAGLGELLTLTETDLQAFDVLGYALVPEPTSGAFLLLSLLVGFRRRYTRNCPVPNPSHL